jgi:hypothetical protein
MFKVECLDVGAYLLCRGGESESERERARERERECVPAMPLSTVPSPVMCAFSQCYGIRILLSACQEIARMRCAMASAYFSTHACKLLACFSSQRKPTYVTVNLI